MPVINLQFVSDGGEVLETRTIQLEPAEIEAARKDQENLGGSILGMATGAIEMVLEDLVQMYSPVAELVNTEAPS